MNSTLRDVIQASVSTTSHEAPAVAEHLHLTFIDRMFLTLILAM